MIDCEVVEITAPTARGLVKRYHYLGSKGFRFMVGYGLRKNDTGEIIAAAVFHSPSVPETTVSAFGLERTEQEGVWELGRFVIHPDYNRKNFGSYLLGRSIKLLRKSRRCRAIITYADSTYHTGALYQATNFLYCGLSAPKKDFYVNGKIKERGSVKGVAGEWRDRPQKHRYVMVFDKELTLHWPVMAYVKQDKKYFENDKHPAQMELF